MASGSLAYRPTQDRDTGLTKFGFLVYAGTVRDFHEWEFRALTRWNQTEKDDKKALASKFLDSLRGEAYIIAEDLGSEVLYSENNIPAIVEAVRKILFPLLEQESKELYRLGTQVGGLLARQPGEPMMSYFARRKRWWRKLQQLDKNVAINEAVLTDLILDNSGLNRQERLMVLTAMGTSTKVEDAEKALIKMHSRIHATERRTGSKGGTGGGKGKGSFVKKFGKGKGSSKGTSFSYLSAVEEIFDSYDEDGTALAANEETDHGDDWVYHGEGGDDTQDGDDGEDADLVAWTADSSLRDVELDVFTAFLGTDGFDESDRDGIAFLSEAVQSETVAFMVRSKAKGKGKPVKGGLKRHLRPTWLRPSGFGTKLCRLMIRPDRPACPRQRPLWSTRKLCTWLLGMRMTLTPRPTWDSLSQVRWTPLMRSSKKTLGQWVHPRFGKL